MSWVDLPIFAKLIGGSPDPRPADESGDISERLSYVVGALAIPGQRPIMGLPGYYTLPISKTVTTSEALTENINYFRNLTINAGQVLTGVAGCTIIVVENTLTFGDAASQISVNALGAKGGTGTAASSGKGGGGGGTGGESGTNFGYATDNTTTTVPAPVLGNTDATISTFFADGNGAAWSAALGADRIDGWGAMFYLLDLMQKRGKDSAANGGIGGGGGGGGGTGNSSGTTSSPGTRGTHGAQGLAARNGGGGGSGFGGGGQGGQYALSQAGGGTGATGGRGGGVLVVIAKNIVASGGPGGLITADGGAGGTGSSTVSSGGGGGGGCAALYYESLTGTLPTVRANGGAAGTGASGNAGSGAAGGNGLALAHKIRAGV